MSKLRRPERPPRQCIFCDRLASSPEHLWSKWMGRYFKKTAHDKSLAAWQRFHPDPHDAPQVREQHGHSTTLKIKAVCKRCNNEWMSGIEQVVGPVLGPMMLGHSVTLGDVEQRSLALWIALKLMVFEQAERNEAAIPRAVCEEFKASRTMPANMRIWLFHSANPEWAAGITRDSASLLREAPPPGSLRPGPNTQAVLFGLREVLVYASHSQIADFDLSLKVNPLLGKQIWPRERSEVLWPPVRSLSFREVGHLATTFNRFMNRAGREAI